MFDASSRSEPALQRATGELAVGWRVRDGATVLDTLRQAGCLKARFPRDGVDGWAGIVTMNLSGGIAGGDRLDSRFVIGEGARASIAGQAAERFYRALPASPPARVRTRIEIAAGAAAEWLAQESILFDRCALDRRLDVELAADARFLGVEMLVFGRAAMGETVRHAVLGDVIAVRREGRPVLREAIRLDGAADEMLRRPAIAAGGRALATLVHVAPDAEARLDAVRAALQAADAGASAWDGLLVARILAPDGAALRRIVVATLAALRDRPLPRVWLC
ncbi:MAG: urease accessory protein UreD [Acetobacteraceae bacterium]